MENPNTLKAVITMQVFMEKVVTQTLKMKLNAINSAINTYSMYIEYYEQEILNHSYLMELSRELHDFADIHKTMIIDDAMSCGKKQVEEFKELSACYNRILQGAQEEKDVLLKALDKFNERK